MNKTMSSTSRRAVTPSKRRISPLDLDQRAVRLMAAPLVTRF